MPSVLEENVPDNVNEDNVLCRFLSFDVKWYYSVRSADENGVVVISSWCGEYASDEDGFGREEYYDWWFLDENLKQISGTSMVHSHSYRDHSYSPRYKNQYNKAVSSLRGLL